MKTKKIKLDSKEFFLKLTSKEKHTCFFHSETKNGFEKIIAFNPVKIFTYTLNKTLGFQKNFKDFVETETKKGNKLLGYISYDIGHEIQNIKGSSHNDLGLPDIYFFSFDQWISFGEKHGKINYRDKEYIEQIKEIKSRPSTKNSNQNITRSKNFKPETTKENYKKAYNKIKKHIQEGDIYQINLTHRLKAETTIPSKELFIKTLEKNNVDFLAYIEGDDFEILSASPERFVKIKNKKIETCPVKGTRPRGKTRSEDKRQVKELLESAKEAAELNMITDLLRNDLGKIAKKGTVKVKGHRLLSKCPTVWHTYSKITATLKEHPTDAIFSMLSGGSITGCPKKRAMEIIDQLEETSRGIYTGIIGQISNTKKIDFSIAIRTIIKKGKNLYLQVGGGIVFDSEEKAEFEETLHKAQSFMDIL